MYLFLNSCGSSRCFWAHMRRALMLLLVGNAFSCATHPWCRFLVFFLWMSHEYWPQLMLQMPAVFSKFFLDLLKLSGPVAAVPLKTFWQIGYFWKYSPPFSGNGLHGVQGGPKHYNELLCSIPRLRCTHYSFQKFGVSKNVFLLNCFEGSLLCSPMLHLFDQLVN